MTSPWPWGNLKMFGYDLIIMDVPLEFELRSAKGIAKSPQAHYDMMPLADIKALRVGELAARDCLLLYFTMGWAIANGTAYDIVTGYGFNPITELVWRKTTVNGKVRVGTGYRARSMHEPIILATMGNPKHKPFPSIFDGLARENSRKPDEFYEMVLRHTPNMMHRADLFSRQTRPGFEGWGNEHGKFDHPTTTPMETT